MTSTPPKSLAEGSLARTPFPHVLVYLDQRQLTGTLAVWPDPPAQGAPDRIRFAGGWPVAARLGEPASSLERGLLPLFRRARAPYAFYAEDVLGNAPGVVGGKVDPLALVAASLRGFAHDTVVDAVLGRLGSSAIRLRPLKDLSRLGLEGEEWAFVELVAAEPLPVARLIAQAGLPVTRARRLLYLLAITQSIEPYTPGATASHPPTQGSGPLHISQPPRPRHSMSVPSFSSPPGPAQRASGASRTEPEAKRQVVSKPPRVSQRPLAPHEAQPPPLPPEDLPKAHAVRWRHISARYRDIDRENYFQMLGVDQQARTQDIKNAYFQLVKTWHPDRLPPELAPLKPVVAHILGLITRAHETLTDETQRPAYVKAVKEGGGTPAAERLVGAIMDAALEFQKVEVLVRRHSYPEALELLRRVIGLNPDEADYHAMHAWLLYKMAEDAPPGEGAQLQPMLRAVDRALELHDGNERAHHTKALILKRMDRYAEALKHFRRTVEINPRNTDAQRELRIAAMRQERRMPSDRPGILSKLFPRR